MSDKPWSSIMLGGHTATDKFITPTQERLEAEQAGEGFKKALQEMDDGLWDLDWTDPKVEDKPTESYLKLIQMGWIYDGLHGAGGGMGYHICHEFRHPKYGRLAFEADSLWHTDRGTEAWWNAEKNHPYRQYYSWFWMLNGDEFSDNRRIDSGETLEELEQVLHSYDMENK